MDKEEKLDRIADVLDIAPSAMNAETRLDELGWDSMGMLGVIALAKSCGRTVTGDQVRAFETIGDIMKAVFP